MLDYYANPANTQVYSDGGTGDMGDLDWPEDGIDKARFWLPDVAYVVSFIRVHFSGSGSGTADMAINIDSGRGTHHDTLLHTVDDVGIGTDANWRVPLHEIKDWVLQADDVLVLTWTNPDANNIAWGAEVGLIAVRGIGGATIATV